MVIREGLSDKVTFVQISEEKERSNDSWSKSIPGRRKSVRVLRLQNSWGTQEISRSPVWLAWKGEKSKKGLEIRGVTGGILQALVAMVWNLKRCPIRKVKIYVYDISISKFHRVVFFFFLADKRHYWHIHIIANECFFCRVLFLSNLA